MHTITLNVQESFFPHLKVLLDQFVQTNQLSYTHDTSTTLTKEEADQRVTQAVERYRHTDPESYLSHDEAWDRIRQRTR